MAVKLFSRFLCCLDQCQQLVEPIRGYINRSTDGLVTMATIYCDFGNSLNGNKEVTCTSDGLWDAIPGYCGTFLGKVEHADK